MSLVVTDLSKVFGHGHTEVKAVSDVSLQVEPGEVVLIMGPSGSGKTTLISMIGGLMTPSSGTVEIDGTSVAGLKEGERARFRLNNIGFIFQSFNLLSALTASENVAVPLTAKGIGTKGAKRSSEEILRTLNLSGRLANLPRDLSGGEKQRVAIARALITDPKLVLADEPTANLDSKNGQEVMLQLCSLSCQEKKAVIVVSHDERIKNIAHRVLWMEDGKITKEEKGSHEKTCPHHDHS